jgi:hypothetical protein
MSAKTNANVKGGVDRGDTFEKPPPSTYQPYEKPPLSAIINCDDFEEVARNTLSKKTWAFYSSAATDCYTYERNRSFFSRIWFRTRILRDVSKIDTTTTILGHNVGVPFMVHPAALVKLVHPDGEKGIARGLSKENVPYCVSLYTFETIHRGIILRRGFYRFLAMHPIPSMRSSLPYLRANPFSSNSTSIRTASNQKNFSRESARPAAQPSLLRSTHRYQASVRPMKEFLQIPARMHPCRVPKPSTTRRAVVWVESWVRTSTAV